MTIIAITDWEQCCIIIQLSAILIRSKVNQISSILLSEHLLVWIINWEHIKVHVYFVCGNCYVHCWNERVQSDMLFPPLIDNTDYIIHSDNSSLLSFLPVNKDIICSIWLTTIKVQPTRCPWCWSTINSTNAFWSRYIYESITVNSLKKRFCVHQIYRIR